MRRQGRPVARSTVERLMRDPGLQGVIRGKSVRSTFSGKATPDPLDQVNRRLRAGRRTLTPAIDLLAALASTPNAAQPG